MRERETDTERERGERVCVGERERERDIHREKGEGGKRDEYLIQDGWLFDICQL